MDYHVNQTFQVRKDFNILNETLLIFTSDNDPWNVKCDLGGSSGPFTGIWQASALPFGGGGGSRAKLTTWEAGHRVPFIVHWQEMIKSGTVSNAIGSHLDMMQTIAHLAGFTLPPNRTIDGIDLSPVLFDGSNQGHDYLFHSDEDGILSAVRYHKYKAYSKTYSTYAYGDHIGSVINNKPPLIFDLSHDLAESTSIEVPQSIYDAIDKILLQHLIQKLITQ